MIRGDNLKSYHPEKNDHSEKYCKFAVLVKEHVEHYDYDPYFYRYLLKTLDGSIYIGDLFNQSNSDCNDIYKHLDQVSECILSCISSETKYAIIPLGKIVMEFKEMYLDKLDQSCIAQSVLYMIRALLVKLKQSDSDVCIIFVNDIYKYHNNIHNNDTLPLSYLKPTETIPGLGKIFIYYAQEMYRFDFLHATKTFLCTCVKSRKYKFGQTFCVDIGLPIEQEEIE